MTDSDTTLLIALVFAFLAFAGDLAAFIGNISLPAWLAFELMFCVPCMIPLFMLAIAWDDFERNPYGGRW